MQPVGHATASLDAPAEELKAAEEGALNDDPKYVVKRLSAPTSQPPP